MEKRKTSNDYRKELKSLEENLSSLDAHVTARLLELVNLYPDAIIVANYLSIRDEVKAKSLSKCYVEKLSLEQRIDFIYVIEEWSAQLQPVIQTKIEI